MSDKASVSRKASTSENTRLFIQKTYLWLEKHCHTFLLAAVMIAGAVFLFSNLKNTVYLSEDEARAFTLLSSGQMIYLIAQPVYALTQRQDSVFYLAAALNFVSLILFYYICRLLFGKTVALLSSTIYAVYPLRIEFSRTLYPASFMEPFFLLLVLFCWQAVSRRQSKWMLGAGVSAAVLFLIHPMGYVLIAGALLASGSFYGLKNILFFLKQGKDFLINFVAGFASTFTGAALIFKYFYSHDLLQKLWVFFNSTKDYKNEFKTQHFSYLVTVVSKTCDSLANIFISLVILISIIGIVYIGIKNRNRGAIFFTVLSFAGTGILFSASILGFNPVYDRHFVWLTSFFSLSAGFTIHTWLNSPRYTLKRAGVLFFIFLIVACSLLSGHIIKETFKITPITDFLTRHKISKKLLLADWNIYQPGDLQGVSLVPLFMNQAKIENNPFWYAKQAPLLIAWPLVYRAYRFGLCEYILTSGIGTRAGVGHQDPLLSYVTPIASWEHPYSVFKNRSFYQPSSHYKIELYRLSDIFSSKEFMNLKNIDRDVW